MVGYIKPIGMDIFVNNVKLTPSIMFFLQIHWWKSVCIKAMYNWRVYKTIQNKNLFSTLYFWKFIVGIGDFFLDPAENFATDLIFFLVIHSATKNVYILMLKDVSV